MVGREIRRRRLAQGLSLSELARMANVSKGYLSEIESSETARPSAATLFRIAESLGVSVAELMDPENADNHENAIEIPASLKEFAEEENLPEVDIRMLAGIKYRGRVPRTPADWRYIYDSIRFRTQGS